MAIKMISIPDELAIKLKEEANASALIVRLLNEYYEMEKTRQLTPEEIDRKIKILEVRMEAEKRIKELENEK